MLTTHSLTHSVAIPPHFMSSVDVTSLYSICLFSCIFMHTIEKVPKGRGYHITHNTSLKNR